MQKIAVFLVAIVGVAPSALADQNALNVTVNSDPAGATVYANRNKQQFGYTPFMLTYKASKDFANGKKCMKLQPIMVRWASGAEASSKSIVICPKDGTIHQQVTLVRPTGIAGREIDEQFAEKVKDLPRAQPVIVRNNTPPPRPSQPSGPRGPKTLYVTYHSDPEGAMLYANGSQPMGYTPVRLKYESPKGFRDGTACAILQPTRVRWASGATAAIDSLQACSVNGGEQSFAFARPTGIKSDLFPNGVALPGLEVDQQFAFQRELLARLDANAAAQASQNAWAQAAAAIQASRPRYCTSQVIGWQIFTWCQ